MKSKILIIIRAIVFFIILFKLNTFFSFLLTDKSYESGLANMYSLNENMDVIFVGTSVTYSGISPLDLYKEYGIKSCNIASDGQSVIASYYVLEEMFKYQKPQVVVMDISSIPVKVLENWAYAVLDYMKPGLTRSCAITNLLPKDKWMNYLFPILPYHSNWKKITADSFHYIKCRNYGGIVSQVSKKKGVVFDTSVYSEPYEIIDSSDRMKFDDLYYEYVLKIIKLCQKKDCKIVFVNMPGYVYGKLNHGDGLTLQRYFNSFYDIADEYDVAFINTLYEMDNIGFDYVSDLRDWRHLSVLGNKKITSYLGKYLVDNYDIQDRRNDLNHESWERAFDDWDSYRWDIYNTGLKGK